MSGTATTRPSEERKARRKDHPLGLAARPSKNPDSALNLLEWECATPGKQGTPWEGSQHKMQTALKEDHPSNLHVQAPCALTQRAPTRRG
ncbi:hypothetical protein HPB49_004197 [Dermacentor silvarum]|uniref:Uncharacterized protein n=1 Tax=Dermacentor silvarum TaxID=543639 RepID=A0ACB8CUW7_DERSI|nr:hypothetical protein HPB49_004197 [Dermacentor silvarum]